MVEYLRPPTRGEAVVVVPHDEGWPAAYAREESRIRGALGDAALGLWHAGSTSVPGLAAKDVVDVVLVVADPADEAAYAPALERAGYVLHLREPEWYEHRLLREGTGRRVNLHVFPPGCEEVRRMLLFSDHLRADADDRALYQRTKLALARQSWERVQDYADAKSTVVGEIMARALRSAGR